VSIAESAGCGRTLLARPVWSSSGVMRAIRWVFDREIGRGLIGQLLERVSGDARDTGPHRRDDPTRRRSQSEPNSNSRRDALYVRALTLTSANKPAVVEAAVSARSCFDFLVSVWRPADAELRANPRAARPYHLHQGRTITQTEYLPRQGGRTLPHHEQLGSPARSERRRRDTCLDRASAVTLDCCSLEIATQNRRRREGSAPHARRLAQRRAEPAV